MLYVCQMCTRINSAAQLVDILNHFTHSVSKLLPRGSTKSSASLFSTSLSYVRHITAALVNILAFRVRFCTLSFDRFSACLASCSLDDHKLFLLWFKLQHVPVTSAKTD